MSELLASSSALDERRSTKQRLARLPSAAQSPGSWTLGARMQEETFTQAGSPLLGNARTSMRDRPSSARPATDMATAHHRAHVQSLARMTREQLAERLFSEKQTIVTLQERLVCLLSLVCIKHVLD
jgi:hypothetical protein